MRYRTVARFVFLIAVCGVIWYGARRAGDQFRGPSVGLDYPPSIDLGPRRFGEAVECPITLRNLSSREIAIDQFSTSCSCAGVERRVDGRLERIDALAIPPREQRDVVVRIGVGAMPGTSQTVSILFQTSDPRQRQGAIRIVIPWIPGGLYIDPVIVALGTRNVGESVERVVNVYADTTSMATVARVTSSRPDRFQVQRVPLTAEDRERVAVPGRRLVDRIMVTAGGETETNLAGQIQIALSDDSAAMVMVPVCGEIIGRVQVTPSVIVLTERTRSAVITLEDRQGEALVVEVPEPPASFKPVITRIPERPESVRLNVSLDPSVDLQRSDGRPDVLKVVVRTAGWHKVIDIPVVWRVEEVLP